jgi:hypothetical protein
MSITLTSEQLPHVHKLLSILQRNHVAFDMSMMGAGKTYTTTELSKMAGFKHVVVICPATVEAKWKTMVSLGLKLYKVISYQSLRSRKGCKPSHDLLYRVDGSGDDEGEITFTPTPILEKIVTEGTLFVFDEAQNIKNKNDQWFACKTISTYLLKYGPNSRFILLSGTPIDKEEHAINLMNMMGFIRSNRLYTYNKEERTLKLQGAQELIDYCKYINPEKTNDFLRNNRINEANVRNICYQLFQQVVKTSITSSMSPPKNEHGISCKNGYFNINDEEDKIKLTEAISMLHSASKYNDKTGTVEVGKDNLGSISRSLMKIEEAKINTFARIAREMLIAIPNSKVGIFVNYSSSIEKLKTLLLDFNPVLLHGTIPKERRQINIDKFQEPNLECRVIIANLQVGSTGIDLDDKTGMFPRVALGSPNYIIQNLHQLTFLFLRRDTKSRAIFRFVYGKCGRKETSILNALARKSKVMKETLGEQVEADIKFPGEYEEDIETD